MSNVSASTTSIPTFDLNMASRFASPKKRCSASPKTASPTPPTPQASFGIPMGFAGQLRAIQDAQRTQADRIVALEKQNAELKASQAAMQDALTRITVLEQHNEDLAARRREAVGQLLNLRFLHQEAGNAFILRSQDIQPDDFEGMVQVYASSVMPVLNHHQRVLGQLSVNGQIQNHATQSSYATCAPNGTYTHHQQPSAVYPAAYNQAGYCRAHGVPYCCRICGQ